MNFQAAWWIWHEAAGLNPPRDLPEDSNFHATLGGPNCKLLGGLTYQRRRMMSKTWQNIVGPRAPADSRERMSLDYLLPTVFMGLAAFCLIVSIFQPYWSMALEAPQYPKGLQVFPRIDSNVHHVYYC